MPESLPLRAASCAAAWLSTVIHHIADLDAAARELRRVLRGDGPVLVRSAFPGREHGITLFRFFPGARRALARFPSVARVGEAFAAAGFRLVEERDVA